MKKTIKQWFETLPEPYRTQALNNANIFLLDQEETNMEDAFYNGFFWAFSPEGYDYWEEFINNISRKII